MENNMKIAQKAFMALHTPHSSKPVTLFQMQKYLQTAQIDISSLRLKRGLDASIANGMMRKTNLYSYKLAPYKTRKSKSTTKTTTTKTSTTKTSTKVNLKKATLPKLPSALTPSPSPSPLSPISTTKKSTRKGGRPATSTSSTSNTTTTAAISRKLDFDSVLVPSNLMTLFGDKLPVMLVLDVSGSMRSVDANVLKQSWQGSIRQFLNAGRSVFVIPFDDKVFLNATGYVTSDAQIDTVINYTYSKMGGMTHMTDAILKAADILKAWQDIHHDAAQETHIWVVTDGNESRIRGRTPTKDEQLKEIITGLESRLTNPKLSILGVGTSVSIEFLMTLCLRFGSEAMFATNMADLGRCLSRTIEYRFTAVSDDVVNQFKNGSLHLIDRIPNGYKQAIQTDATANTALENVESTLRTAMNQNKTIYPQFSKLFLALDSRPLDQVKVVLLGQEPYANEGQAHGLAFSVENNQLPPSLVNILKEVSTDVGTTVSTPMHGNLEPWAAQGVLLLNSIMTVEKEQRSSHARIGWEKVTDRIIEAISQNNAHVVFILWGKYAQEKKTLIDTTKHLVIESAHPSPLGASQAAPIPFHFSKPFSKANTFLASHGLPTVHW